MKKGAGGIKKWGMEQGTRGIIREQEEKITRSREQREIKKEQ